MTAIITGFVAYVALGVVLLIYALTTSANARRHTWPPTLVILFVVGWLPLLVWYGVEMLLEGRRRA